MNTLISSKFTLPNINNDILISPIVAKDRRISSDSVFSDVKWNMSSRVTTPGINSAQKYWDFGSIKDFPFGFSISLAEYAYARLYKPVESVNGEVEWLTVYNELIVLRGFSNFCHDLGISGFSQVNRKCYELYLNHIQFGDEEIGPKSDERIRTIVTIIYRLWEFRSCISESPPEIPFGKKFNKLFKSGQARVNSQENRTPVIPLSVYKSLMTAALDYVIEYSGIIIDVWKKMKVEWSSNIEFVYVSDTEKYRQLQIFLFDILNGCPAFWLKDSWKSYGDVSRELYQLRNACVIVILAYSGIRDSELLSIEFGCCVHDVALDGRIVYYLNTLLHKHKKGGVRDSWIIIAEVVKAVELLEILTIQIRAESSGKKLLITDGQKGQFSVNKKYNNALFSEFNSGSIIYQINCFRDHCNDNLNRNSIPDWINTDGVSMPWHFNARQFRRTLAHHIARQPFGVIAGMLQYKHVEVSMFEGYAGSEPSWNKLLEDEQVLSSVDILDEIAIDLSSGNVSGELGRKLQNEFNSEFLGRAEDYPPSQIAKWLASSNKALFVGKFNFCFFDPGRALCTVNFMEKNRPVLNFCQPGNCANACITKRHATLWQSQLSQAEEFLVHPSTSETSKKLIKIEIASLRSIVSTL